MPRQKKLVSKMGIILNIALLSYLYIQDFMDDRNQECSIGH